ncbi:hypothetical protein ID855_11210 [Xenorhabdus sp. ZM]|uniref:hypothetical protein n=1 Tax=Xenorhabdus szentirmaii TaxID=290112 RepID=UPI0019AB7378|nr:hypothetical protein [Xenorhabdus sp. ZM]MBD2805249.1 hypothetical protein [Xenorhabdus sp. ZM]
MIDMKNTLFITTFLFILNGCSSLNESVLNEKENISDTAYDYIYKKIGAVDRLILTQPKPTLENGIYKFNLRTDYYEFSNQEIIIFNNYLKRKCLEMHGDMKETWCIKSDKPLFFAQISKKEIHINEPINNHSERWNSFAKKMGFKSNNEIAEEKQQQIENSIKSYKYMNEKYNKTIRSDVGTMVCKRDEWDSSAFYIGYIDSKEKSKVKILIIKKAMDINNQIAEIKIEQKQIWDDIKNWYVCNYNIRL